MKKITIALFLSCVSVFFSGKLFSQSETEPNNSFETANRITVNSTITGNLSNSGGIDYYAFEVTTPGAISFNLKIDSIAGNLVALQLYSPNKNSIDYAILNSSGGVFSELVCETGIHYLRIYYFSGSSINSSYTLETMLDLTDPFECNNSIESAKIIEINTTIQAKLLDSGDQEYFAIKVTKPGVLKFTGKFNLSGASVVMQLYSPNKRIIEDRGPFSDIAVLTELVCDTGTYYLGIYTFYGSTNNVSYTIETSFDDDDTFECNNDFATAKLVGLNSTIRAKLFDEEDKDYYAIEINRPGVLILNMLNIPSGITANMSLYSPNQRFEESRNFVNSGVLTELICDKGIYYIVIARNEGLPVNEFYNLEISFDIEDIYECNNDFATAKPIAVNSTIQAKLFDEEDSDYYTIEITKPGVLLFDMLNIPSGVAATLALYSPDRRLIESRSFVNEGILSEIICETGIYYFQVYRSSGAAVNKFYNLKVRLDTEDKYECNNNTSTAAVIPLCETITSKIFDENDKDYFQVKGAVGKPLTVKLLEVPTDQAFSIAIYNQSGFYTYNSGNIGQVFQLEFTPRDTNPYFIKIDADRASSSFYKFTVSEDEELPIFSFTHYHNLPQNSNFSKFPSPSLSVLLSTDNINEREQFKICADSSAASIFEIVFLNNALPLPPNFQDIRLKIKENSQEYYGGFFDLEKSDSANKKLTFRYHHPAYLKSEITKSEFLTIQLYNSICGNTIEEFKIQVFRAPVLMVHGLWGDTISFKTLYDTLLSSGLYLPTSLKIANYQKTNDERFEKNQDVVPNEIDDIFIKLLSSGISFGKADIIAHSMGGLVTRYYLQSDKYRNDINRLITLNTPHSGSQFANMLLDENVPTFKKIKFCWFGIKLSESCSQGAVEDLQVNSISIMLLNKKKEEIPGGNLNKHIVPSHSITSKIDFTNLNNDYKFNQKAKKLLELTSLSVEGYNKIFENDKHDGIVSEISQKGGLDMESVDAVSYFKHFHVGSYQDEMMMGKVQFLLAQKPKSKYFAQNGYRPQMLAYETPEEYVNTQTNNNLSVEIVKPIKGTPVQYGSIIDLEIRGDNRIKKGVFATDYQVTEFQQNTYVGNLEIKPDKLGKFLIKVAGAGEDENKVGLTETYILVSTNQIPLNIDPLDKSDFVHAGEEKYMHFFAKFPDFEANVAGAPDIKYNFKVGLAKYIGDGVIEGITPGVDSLTVTFNGVTSKPVTIRVLPARETTSSEKLEKPKSVNSLELFPNPTSEYILAKFISEGNKALDILVHDLLGKQLQKNRIETLAGENLHKIPLKNLNNGMYILSLFDGQQVLSQKIVIQN